MKKLTFLKSLFLLCALIVGTSTSWAQVSSVAPEDGKSYVVAAYSNSKYYALPNTTSNGSTLTGVEVAVNGSGKVTTENAPTWTFTEGTTTGQFYLSYTSGTNTYYLFKNGTGKTNYNFKVSTGNQNYWSFTESGTAYNVTAVDRGTNNTNIQLDGSTFRCYSSASNIILLEVASSGTATTTTITSTGITNTDLKYGTAAGSLSANVTVTEGGAAVSGATVTWKSSNENAAKIDNDGIVTLVGAGTTTITASYAGDDTYDASTDTYELTVTDTRTATVTTIDDAGITNTDLKNGTAAGTLTAGVTAGGDPVLGATVTWESSDPTVATITDGGVVTLVAVGTTTITASYAGGGAFAASSDTYELTVVDSRQPVSISITNWNTLFNTTYNGSIADNAWPDDSKSLSGEINNVSVTYAKATGSYSYLRDDDLRLYGGTTLAFTAPTNYVITKIVFNANISDAKTAIADVGTFTTSTKTWEGKASSITLTGYIENTGYAKFVSATITLARKLEVAFEDGWMSYVTPCNIEFPEDVEAYVVTSIESGITREKIDEAPEGTPVILHATDGTGVYALTVPESATAPAKNELKASDGSITIDDDNYRKIYVLTVVSNQAGFGPLKKGNTLAAGKAYIEYATAQARDFFAFDSETTGIAKVAVEATDNIDANAPMYNLAGQRVNKSYKGVVIVNGKKMLNK